MSAPVPRPNARRRFGKGRLAGALAMFASVHAFAAPGLAVVTAREGDAALARPEAKAERPGLHASFAPDGHRLETGAKGRIALALSNQSGVEIGPGTRVVAQAFRQERFSEDQARRSLEPSVSKVRFRLERGWLAISAGELRASSTFRVATPHGEIRVNSGQCSIHVDGGELTVLTRAGSATVFNRDKTRREFLIDNNIVHLEDGDLAASNVRATGAAGASELPGPWGDRLQNATAARKRIHFVRREQPRPNGVLVDPMPVVPASYYERPPTVPYTDALEEF